MISQGHSFKNDVYRIVASIPRGKVMTYGDVAAAAGQAHAARIVGGLAHYGPSDLPWQRVVNRFGGLANGYPGGREVHRQHLEEDGVVVGENFTIEHFTDLRWNTLNQS